MTHPTDQLAPYVDGALAPAERAEVDAHLAGCAACREGVALARASRAALRAAPRPTAPAGLGTPALDRMGRQHRSPAAARAVPWLAAAAVIALLAVVLPRLGGGAGSDGGEAADAAGPAVALPLEIDGRSYEPRSLEEAARAFARARDGAAAAQEGLTPAPRTEMGDATEVIPAGDPRARRAMRCVRSAFPGFPGVPVRLVQARFEDRPAYLAFVEEGRRADRPPDTLTVWVAARRACETLAITSMPF